MIIFEYKPRRLMARVRYVLISPICTLFFRTADSYNAAAFVNLGNCCFIKGDTEKAKELYQVALDNDASCVEALYNTGIALYVFRHQKSLAIS